MFYSLYNLFDINIFQYITVRAGIAFAISFFMALFLMPYFIRWAKKQKSSQPIYELAPKTHQNKAGTPTMGGIVFVFSTIVATLLTAKLNNIYVVGGIVVIILFALIGLKDDLSKIMHNKNSAGLTPRAKMFMQIGAALIVGLLLFFGGHDTLLYVPFYKNPVLDMYFFSLLFWVIVIVSATNAVNLTDGLDGLAVVPSIIAFFSLGALVYIAGNFVISQYLLLPSIRLSGELTIIAAAFIGSMIAFLWYNSHPAEVFMGDTGSLSIGAFMGYMAIVSKNEILLLLIGFVFVMETISVILQVGSFKLRQKRVFLMAPIHHHFEQLGWKENKIIVRFWIIAFMTNLLALLTLKVR
ncbi:phospho-N-acetylmuramoyl-pentapeptide-transferase [Arcobacter sp. FWKO B]|uniref:phospho-N-acetylmuramoyl-pentapeptide- transferase n=1 Tax=Arcobacter sp. FWKO B TaxID=2593672 RepID=UPI0018A4937C|nr:phospho-N-acetylmuramoyl-pentapeptide-transferase [Arcobacter sp. FWKO B]QOG11654.1 phospho-N-acetylmuramoyl-pentapeptide-transferase [Arcobacter sp. FWKO B]